MTLKCKEKCRDRGFEEVFTTKVNYPAEYDYCIRLSCSESFGERRQSYKYLKMVQLLKAHCGRVSSGQSISFQRELLST
ncbi:hypothetical protein SLA2020_514830 [Shorea laevis]